MSASSFCLSDAELDGVGGPPSSGRRGGGGGGVGLTVGRRARFVDRLFVRRRDVPARLDPGVDGRRRVLRQQGHDLVRGFGQDRARFGVLDPFRLLLVRNQPVEDRERDDGEQEPRATPKTKPSVRSSAPILLSRIASDSLTVNSETRISVAKNTIAAAAACGDDVLMDIRREVRGHNRVEIIGRRRRRRPGRDRQHLAGEAAQHRQQRRDEDDRENGEIEIGGHPKQPCRSARKTRAASGVRRILRSAL